MAKKLLLDLDGTIADFYRGFSSFLNQHYGTTLDTTHEPPEYDFDKWQGGVEKVNVQSATREWIESGGYRFMPIYPGAADFLADLYRDFDVSIVTARVGTFWGNLDADIEQIVKVDTVKWFDDNGLKVSKLFFDPDKVGFCLDNGISLLVEDKLQTAIEGSKNGLTTILIDRYWNQSPPRLQIFRALDYTQALKYLQNLR